MTTEKIPGMADRIRETLKRRAGGDAVLIQRIDKITNDEVYAQAPADAVDRVVGASPTDRGDVRQWTRYREAAERNLGPKEVNGWIKNHQRAHDLSPRK